MIIKRKVWDMVVLLSNHKWLHKCNMINKTNGYKVFMVKEHQELKIHLSYQGNSKNQNYLRTKISL
jgi:hypothetical protein